MSETAFTPYRKVRAKRKQRFDANTDHKSINKEHTFKVVIFSSKYQFYAAFPNCMQYIYIYELIQTQEAFSINRKQNA
jgi:hypothetical protein